MMISLLQRRWLRFSVRTLLVAVTVFCVWLSWQVAIVRERKAVLLLVREFKGWAETPQEAYVPEGPGYVRVSAIRRMLGDKALYKIMLDDWEPFPDQQTIQRIRKAFPEARIVRWSFDVVENWIEPYESRWFNEKSEAEQDAALNRLLGTP